MNMFVKTLFVLVFSLHCLNSEDDVKQIKATFDGYKTSILNDNGEQAYLLVDSRTKEYYTWLIEGSKSFNKDQFERLGLLNKLQIVMMRHRIPKEEILEMSGKDLFVYAVNKGWVGKNSVIRLGIGAVGVNDAFATGEVTMNGKPSGLFYHFYREEDEWLLDITEMTKWGEAALIQQQVNSEMSVNDYVIRLAEIVSESPVNRGAIFLPLVSE